MYSDYAWRAEGSMEQRHRKDHLALSTIQSSRSCFCPKICCFKVAHAYSRQTALQADGDVPSRSERWMYN